MEILGINLGSTSTQVCVLGLVCCSVPLLLMLLLSRFTGGRLSLLPIVLSALPLLAQEIMGFFERRNEGNLEQEVQERVRHARVDLNAKIQAADQQFNAQVTPPSTSFDAQNTSLDIGPLPDVKDSSRFGVRSNDSSPGRVLRDRRYKRNRGTPPLPDDVYDGLTTPDGEVRSPKGNDLLGPASLPGLRGRDLDDSSPFNRPRRNPRRDTRNNERNDDEIFGGYFDTDGDGYSDY